MSLTIGAFPTVRPRRTRAHEWSRELVAETTLRPSDFIWPVFVHESVSAPEPIASMPGVYRYSANQVIEEVKRAYDLGIKVVALFPKTDSSKKDEKGSEALNPENLVCRVTAAIRESVPGIAVMCDVALDPYTSHGHDGLLKNGIILNDETVEVLKQQAVNQSRAGCSIIAPSDMMDGRIGQIRSALDAAKLQDVHLMAYSAKYASAFYGPFRDAVGSAASLKQGSKQTYQMDSRNSDEAVREAALDISEGADYIMVKPGMPYLDIVRRLHDEFHVPTFVYQVSGEYSMIVAAAERGWIDRDKCMLESLTACKRAGASGVLTYFAREAASLVA